MSILLTKKDVSIASLFEDCHPPGLRFFMQKGISTYLFADEKLTINHLKSLQSSGFKRPEIFALKPHFDYHQKKEVSALAAWLIDQGSFLHSIHTPFCLDYQAPGYLDSCPSEKRKKAQEIFERFKKCKEELFEVRSREG